MKKLARMMSPLPELQRELYATPKWWVVLFSLICLAVWGTTTISFNPFGNTRAETTCAYIFEYMTGIGAILTLLTSFVLGHRAAIAAELDAFRQQETSTLTILGLIFASMPLTYILIFSSIPFFTLVALASRQAADLTYAIIATLVFIEATFILIASIGVVLGILSARNFDLFVVSFIATIVLFFARVFAIPSGYFYSNYHGLTNQIILLLKNTHFKLIYQSHIGHLGITLCLFFALLIAFAVMLIGKSILKHRDSLSKSPALPFICSAIYIPICALCFCFNSHSIFLYFIAIHYMLAAIPLLFAPNHNDIYQNELSKRDSAWTPSTTIGYIKLLIISGVAITPILILKTLKMLHPIELQNLFIPPKLAGQCLLFILSSYAISCLIASLTEHCEMYVKKRGRILAMLLAAIILILPMASRHDIARPLLDTTYWFDLYRRTPTGNEIIDIYGLLFQIAFYGMAAFLLHMYNMKHIRKVTRARRERIQKALALGDREG